MRLLKLLAYALFGYALYEFVRGMVHVESQRQSGGPGGGGGGAGIGQAARGVAFSGGQQNITGPGEGEAVETQEFDGGGMRHRVGRGVVAR